MPEETSEALASPHRVRLQSSAGSRSHLLLELLRFQPTADAGALQTIDHEEGIFSYVKNNDVEAVLRMIDENPECLYYRDAIGGTPVHIAFQYRNHELGKRILYRRPDVGTLTYTLKPDNMIVPDPRATEASYRLRESPNEGQNLLHTAIMHREPELAKWLIQRFPSLVHGETTGKFFEPHRDCYFGSTPLLFALSSNQIDVALKILKRFAKESYRYHLRIPRKDTRDILFEKSTSSEDQNKPHSSEKSESITALDSMTTTILAEEPPTNLENIFVSSAEQPHTQHDAKRIFHSDHYGNNVLHLAVLHNLPNIYDFAINYAMEMLSITEEDLHDDGSDLIPQPPQDGETFFRSDEEPEEKEPTDNNMVDFLKQADDVSYAQMMKFLLARNKDELTPLSLAAAIGCSEMFQHIIKRSSIDAWDFGPIRAYNIPLLDLEQPVPFPRWRVKRRGHFYRLLRKLPFPLAPLSEGHYRSAIECLCTYEVLSSSLSKKPEEMEKVYDKRIEMLNIYEVRCILQKKWKYVYKQRFLTYYAFYCVYLITLNVSLLVGGFGKQPHSFKDLINWSSITWILSRLSDFLCVSLAATKLMNELNSLAFHFWAYISESGAGRWDNIVSIIATVSALLGYFLRVFDVDDATSRTFTAIALIFGWMYHFFFFLGFQTTGPFIIMIMHMISSDLARFFLVFFVVLAGFSQAHFVLLDNSNDIHHLTVSIRQLVIAGVTGEFDYEDNYADKSYIVQAMMWSFIVMVLVLLLNLLIAMMGNTYDRILKEAEGRWAAERSNIMESFESQISDESARLDRVRYGFPFRTRRGKHDMYVQLQICEDDMWREKITAEKPHKWETRNRNISTL